MRTKDFITAYFGALNGREKTPDLIRQYVADEHLVQHILDTEAAFPMYSIEVHDILAEDDKATVRATFHGIHQGDFAGVPATGKKVSAGLIGIYRIESDRVAECWLQFDLFTLLQQINAEASVALA